MPVPFLIQALPAIASIFGGLFGGKPKNVVDPNSQAGADDLTNNYLNPIQNDLNTFTMGKAFKFYKSGMKSLQSGEDFSRNPVAAPFLAMRAAEKAANARGIERDARQVASQLPVGAGHLSAAIQREMQTKSDEANAFNDAAGVSNLIGSIPGNYQNFLNQGEARRAGLRDQYLQGVNSRNSILRGGTTQQPSFMQRLMGAVSPALSMLPGLFKPGVLGAASSRLGAPNRVPVPGYPSSPFQSYG